MRINGRTKIIGFLGNTYRESRMYAVYNTAFETLGLNYAYIPFVAKSAKRAIGSIRHLGIHAVGVTMPFKLSIIPFLDRLDHEAKRAGAVNTVVNNKGILTGHNTDGIGGLKALKEKTEVTNKRVLLLGAGGAARAMAFSIKDSMGNLTILNRTTDDAKDLAQALHCLWGGLDDVRHYASCADIIINATIIGMSPSQKESLVPPDVLRSGITVMDLVTTPAETKLLKDAKKAGCKTVFGHRMLLWQAAEKFKLFTGFKAPVAVMEKALEEKE